MLPSARDPHPLAKQKFGELAPQTLIEQLQPLISAQQGMYAIEGVLLDKEKPEANLVYGNMHSK